MDNFSAATNTDAIAIIGMVGRFPGASNIDEFWLNLKQGVESITFFSDQDLLDAGVDPQLLHHPAYVKAGGVLDDIETFAASFFGYSPREAEIIDPQQRIFLESAWEVLEQAGYDTQRYTGKIGLYASTSMSSYAMHHLYANQKLMQTTGIMQAVISNDKDFLPTRISYKLNLRGPSINVQTACSSSLVAVHLACQALLNGECDMALAGGVSIKVPHKVGYLYQQGGIYSPDGHCRAFDARAQGTLAGNGIGVVLLKPLANALEERDFIFAVIKGSALTNDGAQRVGYTAPGVEGQSRAIQEALEISEIEPETIGYIETHGTGTELGDLIEMQSLNKTFRSYTKKKQFCAIGSVKTNIGHLDAAAGVTGLIKTALTLHHRQIPPSLHFEQPNPHINFAESPFFVNQQLRDWIAPEEGPRRAGVSSFGIGGTNAHVVLEEAPSSDSSLPMREWQLLPLAAQTETALEHLTTNVAHFLAQITPSERSAHPEPTVTLPSFAAFADIAYTYQIGRRPFPYRRVVLARSVEEAVEVIAHGDPDYLLPQGEETVEHDVAFMFPGTGLHYPFMGRDLYHEEPVFREWLERCALLLKPYLDHDLLTVLYPSPEQQPETEKLLKTARYAQTATFVIEYALAMLWLSWGVQPVALIGHSLGEYTAACLANVFSLEDALRLVVQRAILLDQLPPGAMISVPLSPEATTCYTNEHVSLSNINAPSLCALAGSAEEIEKIEQDMLARGIDVRKIATNVAFHSVMLDPLLQPFACCVEQIPLHAPTRPYLSNVSGTWITAAEATDPLYWVRHLRQTVQFSAGVQQLLALPHCLLLEVGPGHSLSIFARQQATPAQKQKIFTSLRPAREHVPEQLALARTLGKLWLAGASIDWHAYHHDERLHRVPAPTYPFERQRYWLDGQKQLAETTPEQSATGKIPDPSRWLYLPTWRYAPLTEYTPKQDTGPWLIFSDAKTFGTRLAHFLAESKQQVIVVQSGEAYHCISDGSYSIRPGYLDDYLSLISALQHAQIRPQQIIHCWSLEGTADQEPDNNVRQLTQERNYESLILLVQALETVQKGQKRSLTILSNNLYATHGAETLRPEKALLLGPCKVVPQEYPHYTTRCIDIVLPVPQSWQEHLLFGQLQQEIQQSAPAPVVAYRGKQRLVQTYEQCIPVSPQPHTSLLRHGGTYLITGGLGRIGLLLTEYLVRSYNARVVLVGRTTLPEHAEWHSWLSAQTEQNRESYQLRYKLQKLIYLEEIGAAIMTHQADVASEQDIRAVITSIEETYGRLHGVFHLAGATNEDSVMQTISGISHESASRQFYPKVNGVITLEKALAGRDLDFCLLFSSNASILGGLGFASYAAANAFLDAFAQSRSLRYAYPWISANWDGWLLEEEHAHNHGSQQTNTDIYTMTPTESLAALEQLLMIQPASQIIVSTGDLAARVHRWLYPQPEQQLQPASLSTHARPALRSSYQPPQDAIEQGIAEIWQDLLGISEVGIYDDFFELGGHSLLASQITIRLQETFHVAISLRNLLEHPRVDELAKLIKSQQHEMTAAVTSFSPLIAIRPVTETSVQPPFFCIHPQGGGVLCYSELARALASEIPFYGLQAPGLEGEQEPITSMDALVARYLAAIQTVQPSGPYLLGGWSLGGIIAFAMAHELTKRGEETAHLIMIDSPAPIASNRARPVTTIDILIRFMQDLGGLAAKDLTDQQYKRLAMLDTEDEQLRELFSTARKSELFPPEFNYRQFKSRYHVFKGNVQLMQTYRPDTGAFPTLLLRAAAGLVVEPEPSWGWQTLLGNHLEILTIPGNHYSIMRTPNVQTVAEHLNNVFCQRLASDSEPSSHNTTAHKAENI